MSAVSEIRYSHELDAAVQAVRAAGQVVRTFYEDASAVAYDKPDGSPVTDADLAADRIIRESISARFPSDALLTEEVADDPIRLGASRCWIADPVDGTAQFIARTGRFDCMLALVVDGRPVVAAIGHPLSGNILCAIAGAGAFLDRDGDRTPVRFEPVTDGRPIRIASSIWFDMPRLEPEIARISAHVSGIFVPLIEVGLRPIEMLAPDRGFDPLVGAVATAETSYGGEWDYAAADLVIHEAGGVMTDLLGRPHQYNKPAIRNHGGLIFAVDPVTHAKVVAAAAAGIPSQLTADGQSVEISDRS